MDDTTPVLEAAITALDAISAKCGQRGICTIYAVSKAHGSEGYVTVGSTGPHTHLLPALTAIVQHFRNVYPYSEVTAAIQNGLNNALRTAED